MPIYLEGLSLYKRPLTLLSLLFITEIYKNQYHRIALDFNFHNMDNESIINNTGRLKSHSTGKTFTGLKNVNCQSSNLIYVITCKHVVYNVGQTKNCLLTRFQGQFNDITHDRDTTVARHLSRCSLDCSTNVLFDITTTSFIKTPPECHTSKLSRDREEKRWMRRLMTIMPSGLNLMD